MKANFIHDIPALSDLSEAFIDPLGKDESQRKIRSSVEDLTQFMGGGVPYEAVTELGIPLSRGGRELLLTFLSCAAHNRDLILWVNGHRDISVFPPAWSARGVPLLHIVFSESQNPLKELAKAFVSPLFKIVVLDTGRFQIGKNELAFLKRRARTNKQAIIVVRDYFLSNMLGNVWVKLRLNVWKNHRKESFRVKVIRGLPPGEVTIAEKLVPQNIPDPPLNFLRSKRGEKNIWGRERQKGV